MPVSAVDDVIENDDGGGTSNSAVGAPRPDRNAPPSLSAVAVGNTATVSNGDGALDTANPSSQQPPPPLELPEAASYPVGKLIITYLLWLCFGFLFFWHWILLAFFSYQRRHQHHRRYRYRYRCYDFFGSLFQFILPIAALAMFASGGAWCRGNSTPCPSGETMSHICLFTTQSTKYQAIYTLHFIGLAYMAIQWVLDGLQLYSWVTVCHLTRLASRSSNEGESDPSSDDYDDDATRSTTTTCYKTLWSAYNISTAYPATILFINVWVTLTWTVIYTDWGTSSTDLASWSFVGRLIAAGLGALSFVLVILHRARIAFFLHVTFQDTTMVPTGQMY